MGTRAETEDARVAWWVDRACEKELPALSGTLGEIERALSKEEYSAFVLARVILQDPPLTSRVLRVANSAFYNPGGRPISMVSRAVMVLGFDSIRSICTSIAIVEALLRGAARDRLLDEIARALHAAVVSRFLARHAHDPAPEEVFVSTLLRRIGHMVLWSLGGSEVDALDEALKSGAADPEALEREILGFPLRKLSLALSAAWRLPTFQENGSGRAALRVPMEELSWLIAMEALKGWSSGGIRKVAREVAWSLSCDEAEAVETMRRLATEAADYALALGSRDVALRIPAAGSTATGLEEDPSAMGEEDKTAELQVLSDISANLLDELDVNSILQMVLEGIHRGVGMDRTAMAIVDPRSGLVRCKMALGKDRRMFVDGFEFPFRDGRTHALLQIIADCSSKLLDPSKPEDADFWHPVYSLFGGAPFLAQAVSVNGKALGLFLADRHSSGRMLDRDAWDNFRLLCRQADIALTLAARSRGV